MQRTGGSGALLPGRNVAVVHVRGNDHSYPASVSLKEPRNTKAFISKAGLLLQCPSGALEGGAGAGEKGVVLRETRRMEGLWGAGGR